MLAATAYAGSGGDGVSAVCAAFSAGALLLWLVRLRVQAPSGLDEAWPEAIA